VADETPLSKKEHDSRNKAQSGFSGCEDRSPPEPQPGKLVKLTSESGLKAAIEEDVVHDF
jgi:hypothetical protein